MTLFGEFVRRHWGNMEYRKNRYAYYEDRRGEGVVAIPGYPFDSIDAIFFVTMMKRE
jgi:hypothetical protein